MKKQIFRIISLLLLTIVYFTSCALGVQSPQSSGAESTFMKVEHSTGFSVRYIGNDVKLVTDAENRKFLLVPRGQQVPSGYDGATVIETPLERALFCSTTQVGMIRPYDIWDNIAGIVSAPGSVATMEQEIEESGADIRFVGGGAAPDYELIQSLEPDLAFVYTGTAVQAELIAKLEELGIPYAVDNEYMEAKHTGRMEWTKFLAAFFNKDEEAVQYTDGQFKMLEEMEALLAGAEKPKVAWGTFSAATGTVYVPGNESFVAEQLRAVGCEYLFSHILGANSTQITPEEFYNKLLEADYWIYSSSKNHLPDYNGLIEIMPVVAGAPVVVNRNVWQYDVDFYYYTDQAAQNVIELAAIFHPDLYPGYRHIHFHPLAQS